jgi:hypothetical protein
VLVSHVKPLCFVPAVYRWRNIHRVDVAESELDIRCPRNIVLQDIDGVAIFLAQTEGVVEVALGDETARSRRSSLLHGREEGLALLKIWVTLLARKYDRLLGSIKIQIVILQLLTCGHAVLLLWEKFTYPPDRIADSVDILEGLVLTEQLSVTAALDVATVVLIEVIHRVVNINGRRDCLGNVQSNLTRDNCPFLADLSLVFLQEILAYIVIAN